MASDPTPDDVWCQQLAGALSDAAGLGPGALTPRLHGRVLRIARDVAHGTERKNAPVAAFLAGRYVQARHTQDVDAETALNEVAGVVARLLPATPAAPQGD